MHLFKHLWFPMIYTLIVLLSTF